MIRRAIGLVALVLVVAVPVSAQETIVPGRNQLWLRDGTAAAPADSFDRDRDTGRYRIGDNNVGEATGGVLRFDWNTTRVLFAIPTYLPDGDSGAPSIARSATPGTGIYFALSQVSFAIGGNQRHYFDSQTHYILSDSAEIGWGVSSDVALRRTIANQLDLASGDSFNIVLGALRFASVLAISGTAPTTPVACTAPAVLTSNGTFALSVDVGTTCAGISTLVLTFPAAANGWECHVRHITTPASFHPRQSGSTTTSVTITNYSATTGLAIDWVDGNDVGIGPCAAR